MKQNQIQDFYMPTSGEKSLSQDLLKFQKCETDMYAKNSELMLCISNCGSVGTTLFESQAHGSYL